MAKKETEPGKGPEPALNKKAGFIITFGGDILPATVDDAGNIVGWNESVHAHFTFFEEQAKLASAQRKGVVTV